MHKLNGGNTPKTNTDRGDGPGQMPRREMIWKSAKALVGIGAASLLGGCDGEKERLAKVRKRMAAREAKKKPLRGSLISPAKSLEKYAVTFRGNNNAAQSTTLGKYLKQVSDGRPAIVVFATHYHSADAPECNTPLAVAEKLRRERPGMAVVGVLANLVSSGSLENVVGEMGLGYPVVAMKRETYYGMENNVCLGTSRITAMVADTEQKAVYCTREYENPKDILEKELLEITGRVLRGNLSGKAESSDAGGRKKGGRVRRMLGLQGRTGR